MGLMQRRKGRAFEQKIAREFRLRWPDALVRRASQAERAYEPDVFIENGPQLLSSLWLEMHDARNPTPKAKLEQAERDVHAMAVARCAVRLPVVVWHKLGERSIQVTMRSWAFAWLAYNESHPESRYVVTMDLGSFMNLIESAARRMP